MEFELFKGRDPKSNRLVWALTILPYFALLLWIFFNEFEGSFSAVFAQNTFTAVLVIAFPTLMTVLMFWDRRYSQGKFIVADEGITFQTEHVNNFMPWDNLSHVVIRRNMIHFYSNIAVLRVKENITTYPANYTPKYFTGKDGRLMIQKEPLTMLSPKSSSPYYMYVKYSSDILDEVKKHFKKDITNEYALHMKGAGKWL